MPERVELAHARVPLPGLDGDRQPVRRRRQRADPARVVGAGRVVGEVEVEHEPAVVFPEIRALHRVEEVAAAAVALPSARRVAEAEEERRRRRPRASRPRAASGSPPQLEVRAGERPEEDRLGPARLDRLAAEPRCPRARRARAPAGRSAQYVEALEAARRSAGSGDCGCVRNSSSRVVAPQLPARLRAPAPRTAAYRAKTRRFQSSSASVSAAVMTRRYRASARIRCDGAAQRLLVEEVRRRVCDDVSGPFELVAAGGGVRRGSARGSRGRRRASPARRARAAARTRPRSAAPPRRGSRRRESAPCGSSARAPRGRRRASCPRAPRCGRRRGRRPRGAARRGPRARCSRSGARAGTARRRRARAVARRAGPPSRSASSIPCSESPRSSAGSPLTTWSTLKSDCPCRATRKSRIAAA